jgi:hypothetical protein
MKQLCKNELHYDSNPNKVYALLLRYKQWLKAKYDFTFQLSICHFQLAHRQYFSAIFHTLHIIFCKGKHWENVNCCISILLLDPRTVQPVVSRYTDWATGPTLVTVSISKEWIWKQIQTQYPSLSLCTSCNRYTNTKTLGFGGRLCYHLQARST